MPNAFDLMLTGKSVKAVKAKRMGLVDMLVEPLGPGQKAPDQGTRDYLEEVAIQTARDLASGKLKKTPKKKSLQDKAMAMALKYPFVQNLLLGQVLDRAILLYKSLLHLNRKLISTGCR